MSVPPAPIVDRIEWFEQRITSWTAAPTTIGLTAAQCTALNAAITASRKAYSDALAARIAAKNATTVDALERVETPKGIYLAYRLKQ